MLRHFLEIDDLSEDEVAAVLDASEKPAGEVLAKKGVALIFEKPSLRTRNSCEMAVVALGGHPVYITDNEISLDQRETVEDATRTLNGYFSVIAARVFEHSKLERMAAVSQHPVVNLLSDAGHPVQALADLLTIRQSLGSLHGVTIGWVGDFSNVARSLALGAVNLGASFRFAGPTQYAPSPEDLDRVRARCRHGATISVHTKPSDAVQGANVVSTDAWYSMGQEGEKEARRRAMEGCTVDQNLMRAAAADAVFLHCLPAHRSEEVTSEVLDGPQSRIWRQAQNRMHTFRGLLLWLSEQGAIL
jgi:ornithine carbamoyltransferase